AALRGLHEAARVPIPPSLPNRVRRRCLELELAGLADLSAGPFQLGELTQPSAGKTLFSLGKGVPMGMPKCDDGHNDDDVRAGVQAILRLLDRHSALLSGPELNRGVVADYRMSYGLELADCERGQSLLVTTVEPGGPAQKAGLRPGDRITHVDDHQITVENASQ